ncbi:helix-turn-helix domain-containing protein [Haladaptatus sp. GCM10025893]|uniref:helix-turn-helix domain-containing protein n=1 Tax=Haladaptatus sp. GCM10025893 TaxID=3252659 RepID=UPI00362391A1
MLVVASLLAVPATVAATPDDPLSDDGTTTNTTTTDTLSDTQTTTETTTTTEAPTATDTLTDSTESTSTAVKDETSETLDGTDESVEETSETVEDTATAVEETATDTTDDAQTTVTDTVDSTLNDAASTAEDTDSTVEDGAKTVTETVDDTLSDTDETVETVTEKMDDATETVAPSPDGTTEVSLGDTGDAELDDGTETPALDAGNETPQLDSGTETSQLDGDTENLETVSEPVTDTVATAGESVPGADDATLSEDAPATTTFVGDDEQSGDGAETPAPASDDARATADETDERKEPDRETPAPAGGAAFDGDSGGAQIEGGEKDGRTPTGDSTGTDGALAALSAVNIPEPVDDETGIALGIGAIVTAGVFRYGSAVDLSGFGQAAGQATHPLVRTQVNRVTDAIERLFRIVAPFRYSRFDDSDPLEHDGREAVYEVINESPGAYLSEVATRADIPLSTTRHHIRVLEREKLVSGAKVRGKRRFYVSQAADIELAAALADEATAAVLDALSRLGPSSVSDLAGDLERDPSTVTHHLQRLEENDIVKREREGRAVINRLSPAAKAALSPDLEPTPGEPQRVMADGSGQKNADCRRESCFSRSSGV